jgi:TonB family protein
MHSHTRPSLAPRRALFAIALAAALLPDAASAQDRRAILLSDARPPRSGCQIERRTVATDQLVDSAGLHAALVAHQAERPMTDSAFLLLSVRVNEAGSVTELVTLEGFIPPGADAELRDLLQPFLRTGGRGLKAFRIRLAPASADAPVRVGKSEICPPGGLRSVQFSMPLSGNAQKPGTVRVRTRVAPTGQILSVHPISSSGFDWYDEAVVSFIMRRPMHPGLIDGAPVEMEFEQTVLFSDRMG